MIYLVDSRVHCAFKSFTNFVKTMLNQFPCSEENLIFELSQRPRCLNYDLHFGSGRKIEQGALRRKTRLCRRVRSLLVLPRFPNIRSNICCINFPSYIIVYTLRVALNSPDSCGSSTRGATITGTISR